MPAPPPRQVHLVYARRSPDADEPLVAVAASEEEARDVEREVLARHAGSRVAWEVHEVQGLAAAEVHVVVLGTSQPPVEDEPDPIGLAVFADRAAAEDLSRRKTDAEGASHYAVRSLPLGWRRSGWPFDD